MVNTAHAQTVEVRHAWFVQNAETKQWCAFVDEASAGAVAEDERFDWSEAARLEYGDAQPVTLLVTLQSEGAYVDDSYTFAPDLDVTQVLRTGRYIEDPFFTATYRLDQAGKLQMTAESVEAGRTWEYTTYFLEWPVYRSFSELPFAALIETTPRISVSANC